MLTRARQAARSFLQQFDASEQNPSLHHRLTWHVFKENVSFRAELEAFSSGADLHKLPQLRRLVWELLFIPVADASDKGLLMFPWQCVQGKLVSL